MVCYFSNKTPFLFQKNSSLSSTLQNSKGYTIKCEELQHKLSKSLLSPTNLRIFVSVISKIASSLMHLLLSLAKSVPSILLNFHPYLLFSFLSLGGAHSNSLT